MIGRVKKLNPAKDYCFITGEDGRDYFVRCSDVEALELTKGCVVEFTPSQTDRGLVAENVTLY